MSHGACIAADATGGDRRQALGRRGERLAAAYLCKQGYTILEMNFRSRYGELDIIAFTGETLVFVEVKARLNRRFGEPFEAVTAGKQARIRRMARSWLARPASRSFRTGFDLRFDVISIVLDGGGSARSFEHLEDAFR